MQPLTLLLFILLNSCLLAIESEKIVATVCSPNRDSPLKSFYFTEQPNADCPEKWATVYYDNSINRTGWAFLDVKVLIGGMDPFKTGYVAGFAEGNATRKLIKLHKRNLIDPFCDQAEEFCIKLYDFLEENYNWVQSMIKKNSTSYWNKVAMVYGQVKGLIDGYEGFFNIPLSPRQIVTHPVYMLQLFGDLFDLKDKLHYPEEKYDVRPRPSKSHCSALIKVLPNQSDILFSHNTWVTYASMLRVQKRYSFPLAEAGRTFSFSGYPGTVSSIDDFIITSAKLAILETTIEIHKDGLYEKIVPQSLFTFVRAPIAHMTASTGKEWASTFSLYNSGTYNDQWLVLDYKKFKKGRPTQEEGLLTMLEQMPGMIVIQDISEELMQKTYWPGYNRAYSPQLFKYSGAHEMVKKFGNWYSYDNAPRALIFARNHSTINEYRDLYQLMRYNNFKEDPLSRCDCNPPYSAESTIAARSELNSPNGKYPIKDLGFMDQGATDVKITSSVWAEDLMFFAVSGPPGGQYQGVPEFNWETSILKDTVNHYGQPSIWRFEPCLYNWEDRVCSRR